MHLKKQRSKSCFLPPENFSAAGCMLAPLKIYVHWAASFIPCLRDSISLHLDNTNSAKINHERNICVFKARAITTHSSDAFLHQQRLSSYRKGQGLWWLDTQEQQRERVWDSQKESGVSMQTTEGARRVGEQRQRWSWEREEGGRAATVSSTRKNKAMDPTSRAHKGQQKSSHPRSVPWIRYSLTTYWLLSDRTNLTCNLE